MTTEVSPFLKIITNATFLNSEWGATPPGYILRIDYWKSYCKYPLVGTTNQVKDDNAKLKSGYLPILMNVLSDQNSVLKLCVVETGLYKVEIILLKIIFLGTPLDPEDECGPLCSGLPLTKIGKSMADPTSETTVTENTELSTQLSKSLVLMSQLVDNLTLGQRDNITSSFATLFYRAGIPFHVAESAAMRDLVSKLRPT
ncbi:hypothetical protein ROZALSC1DRAFT_24578 [Rozella allomycis CSF55]|uniref:Uncharacterized protein n=1 Tax=Rozella allomycis (strain CSF55) TaxID=988480 RepID=A0A4V1IZ74_ROZAC|nr:hypothetical protein ROZALSC1DRAFT_24578 [Rozella allomycis CSF55]